MFAHGQTHRSAPTKIPLHLQQTRPNDFYVLLLSKTESASRNLAKFLAYLTGALMILMVCVVFCDVMMRYLFNSGSIAMQELEWHLFAAIFLLGAAYALREDSHVRVDVFYDRFSPKEKAIVNIFGILFMLIPFCTVIAYGSIDFVAYSFSIVEKSPDPGGLPYRFILKSLIPLSYVLLLVQGIGEVCRNLKKLCSAS